MEEEKVLKSTAEKALMSLAHEILRKRNRMSLSDIHDKAAAIMAIIPSHIMRSVAGGYDNESISVAASVASRVAVSVASSVAARVA